MTLVLYVHQPVRLDGFKEASQWRDEELSMNYQKPLLGDE